MTRQDFASALRALAHLDGAEAIAAGVALTPGEVRRFEDDPCRFFLRCSDERAAVLWRLMATRTRVGFADVVPAPVLQTAAE